MRQPPYLVPHLLTTAATVSPEAIAVVDGDQRWSYGRLDAHSNRLGRVLQRIGVRRGDRVGVFLDKSAAAVASLYAVMKAGAAYVPLDPDAPTDRLRGIAEDCAIACLVTAAGNAGWPDVVAGLPDCPVVMVVDGPDGQPLATRRRLVGAAEVVDTDAAPLDVGTVDQDLAYILYTSGSTGMPKGVMLTHRNALAFIQWAAAEFDMGEGDVLSSHAPFHFDLSVLDLYAAAAGRATVVLVPPKLSLFPKKVVEFIERHGITVWYSVPSILSMIATRGGLEDGDLPSLRTVLFAGEVFPTKFLRLLMGQLPHARFANLYGPTETNVCTWYEVPPMPEDVTAPIPIGKAVANDTLYIVRDDGTVAEPGEGGELWVRGATVMRGYWGDDQRTAARLLPDPFGTGFADPVYRTGDIVVPTQDGTLQFIGRRDAQVKSRGYRIELGDVESAVYTHPAVRECAVIAVADELITNRLHAFVVLDQETPTSELVRSTSARVPRYMVPESFTVVDRLPQTSTGKVDRRELLRCRLEQTPAATVERSDQQNWGAASATSTRIDVQIVP